MPLMIFFAASTRPACYRRPPNPQDGSGGEATGETRAWQFGDELHDIDFGASLHTSFHRGLDGQLQATCASPSASKTPR